MLKLLLKKQLMEIFKTYFYDAKKNRKRSKAAMIIWFIFFGLIMVGVLGGMFTYLSLSLCGPLVSVNMGWLYFLLMSGISILLGAFGSVFNTYSGLYLSKDNDLLLSMPIPVRDIIASRLMGVYLMGVLYSAAVILPAVIVYLCVGGFTVIKLLCCLALMLIISLIVLILSCLLGWCVAKISLKIKQKSFVIVLASLAFIGLYYFVYFKVQKMISDLIANAAVYGEQIRDEARGLYLFGRVGEGDLPATLLFLGITAVLLGLTWFILRRTFLSIATSSAAAARKKGKVRSGDSRVRTPFAALMSKELKKFTSCPSYMLNCGLGILLLPACGVLLLLKGPELMQTIASLSDGALNDIPVIFCAMLILLSAMIDTAAPAVSLEGKNVWIPQTLPVTPKAVLRAKAALQLILSGIPLLFVLICGLCVIPMPFATLLAVCLLTVVYTFFSAMFCSFAGIRMPNLSWTSEIVPIKQSGAVTLALFGEWAIGAAFIAVYFLIGSGLGAGLYIGAWTVLFAAVSVLLQYWLDHSGAKRFAAL